eukprot:5163080-Alexandrium_andersonii.AAC.1
MQEDLGVRARPPGARSFGNPSRDVCFDRPPPDCLERLIEIWGNDKLYDSNQSLANHLLTEAG